MQNEGAAASVFVGEKIILCGGMIEMHIYPVKYREGSLVLYMVYNIVFTNVNQRVLSDKI